MTQSRTFCRPAMTSSFSMIQLIFIEMTLHGVVDSFPVKVSADVEMSSF